MATIIAGRLQLQHEAEETIEKLIQAGFAPEKTTSFYLNPPGQHAVYPIGGDRYQSPNTEELTGSTTFSEALTEVTEAVIGANQHKPPEKADSGTDSDNAHQFRLRRAGMLVAVELNNPSDREQAVALLTQFGAENIEQAEGKIIENEWVDFDPLSEPCYL